jgi:hypothetical protein
MRFYSKFLVLNPLTTLMLLMLFQMLSMPSEVQVLLLKILVPTLMPKVFLMMPVLLIMIFLMDSLDTGMDLTTLTINPIWVEKM